MANLTRAQMVDRVLQRLNVLGAGQSAPAADSTLVGEIVDSIYNQFRARGRAPFAISAFPEWAQEPFIAIFSYHAAPYYGTRHPVSDLKTGENDLVKQLRTHNQGNPTRAKYY